MKNKYVTFILTLIIIAFLSSIIISLVYSFNKVEELEWNLSNSTQKILKYNLIRSKTKPVEENEIRRDIADLSLPHSERPIVNSTSTFSAPGQTEIQQAISTTTWILSLPDDKNKRLKLAKVTLENNKWYIQVFKQTYIIKTVIQETKTKEWNTYTQLTIEDEEGTKYRPKALYSDTQVNRDYLLEKSPRPKMNWWNPKVSLGIEAHVYQLDNSIILSPLPTLSLSSIGYGATKNDQKLKLVELVLSGDRQTIGLGLSPISLRISERLPNTYFRPVNFGYKNKWNEKEGSISLGTGINVSF